MTFASMFEKATGHSPYPYQIAFAESEKLPELMSVPTGVGKTATAILGWLYRKRFASKAIQKQTPRRLVYCLPMRTLVEQTEKCARTWMKSLGLADKVKVHLLMGGEDDTGWDSSPEADAILIGTQDMLLSRALNRGYGMSRYRWPMHFGLLNNDCLWVMDETQLMGVGLTTSVQLQGLRTKLNTYGISHSLWMSATLDIASICTVDHIEPTSGFLKLGLTSSDQKHPPVKMRLNATKKLTKSKVVLTNESEKKGYAKELATAIQVAHHEGTLTLVVVNRVTRAQAVFVELEKMAKAKNSTFNAEIALIHARFRPCDRRKQEESLFTDSMPEAGKIVVATQAIEAGVDVSSATLFTELAPWSSLVQRIGRCNRGGEFAASEVIWVDIQSKDENDKTVLPYEFSELEKSRDFLASLKDVGPQSLSQIVDTKAVPVVHTLRRKDLLDLWDTTPDLAGNDLDISRYIRDGDDTDVQFYWREFAEDKPSDSMPKPEREELCSVRIGAAREFLKKLKDKKEFAFAWKSLDRAWQRVDSDELRSGMVLLLKPIMGGYDNSRGWTGNSDHKPTPLPTVNDSASQDSMDSENWGEKPVLLTQHLKDVTSAVSDLQKIMANSQEDIPWDSLLKAAQWHDVGKAHPAFVSAMLDSPKLTDSSAGQLWAKSGKRGKPNYRMPDGTKRNGFRHELASALVWLVRHDLAPDANLIAFLIAAHHGKVRGSLRSLPNETRPIDDKIKFARGIWDGDELPPVQLDNGETVPATKIDLSLMELGEGKSGESWLARILRVRDQFGPFRLSYLETLLRVADWRGSDAGDKR